MEFNLYIMFCFQIAALLTLPFDVIKTHRQIELGEKMFFKGKILHLSFFLHHSAFFIPIAHQVLVYSFLLIITKTGALNYIA